MKIDRRYIYVGIFLVVTALVFVYYYNNPSLDYEVTSDFDSCVSSGGEVLGSQCMLSNLIYTEGFSGYINLNNCESYFDGCNTCFVQDGQIGGCTRKYCEVLEKPECLKIKEDSLNEEDVRICTMEYAPVCGINSKTYANRCLAGDMEILYEGEC